jgi:hypothetical protein
MRALAIFGQPWTVSCQETLVSPDPLVYYCHCVHCVEGMLKVLCLPAILRKAPTGTEIYNVTVAFFIVDVPRAESMHT